VFLLFLLPIVAIGAGGYWFFRVFLPRQVTGSIECNVEPQRVKAGETVRGTLRFTPKRNMTINAIQWTVSCGEKCVSGSGSDRKTHYHEILKHTQRLAEPGELRVGQPQSFDFSFPIPADPPPSLKFTDNELNWVGELRIDIAKWPDWVQSIPLTVVPSPDSTGAPPRILGEDSSAEPASAEEAFFHDFLRQVERCQDDPANLQLVLDAVRDHIFSIRVDVVEPLDEAPPKGSNELGKWAIANPRRTDVEIALVWPPPQEPAPLETYNWRGQAIVLDYDDSIDCLLMRVVG
jgi:hypothetical protein